MRIRPVLVVAAVCWAAATAVTFAVKSTVNAEPTQSFSTVVAAADLTHLDLSAPDGSVDLRSSADGSADAVTVSVAVRPAGAGWRKPVPPGDPKLIADAGGHVLRLGLRGVTSSSVEADWTITAPARFSARVGMHDGRVMVAGLTGGVHVSLDSGLRGRGGEIAADVPGGALDLELGVGSIDARTSSPAFGAVDLHSTVGDAHLFLDGHELVTPRAPGPGHRLHLSGDRNGALALSVTVGTVQLRIR